MNLKGNMLKNSKQHYAHFQLIVILFFQIILCIAYIVSFFCLAYNLERLLPWIFLPVFMAFTTVVAVVSFPLLQKTEVFNVWKFGRILFVFAAVFAICSSILLCYVFLQFIFNAVQHFSVFFFTESNFIYPMLFAEFCGVFSLGFYIFYQMSLLFNSVNLSATQSTMHFSIKNNVLIIIVGVFTVLLVVVFCLSAFFMQTNTIYDEMILCQKRYAAFPIGIPNAFSVSSKAQIGASVFPDQDYDVTYNGKEFTSMLGSTNIDTAGSYLIIKDSELELHVLLACKDNSNKIFIAKILYTYHLNSTALTYTGITFYSNNETLANGNDGGLWISKLGEEYMGYYYETVKPHLFSEIDLQEISAGIVRNVVISDFMANQLYLFKQPSYDILEK